MNQAQFSEIKLLIFDWGDTLMRDFREKDGPMCFWDYVEVIYGVENFLDICYDKFPMAIASNSGFSTTEMMIKALNRGGIDRYFSQFFTSKDIGVEKPHPHFFQHILDKIPLKPEAIAFIGNDYNKDIKPSKKAGMKTLFFNEHNTEGDFPDADFIFNNFDALSELFSK